MSKEKTGKWKRSVIEWIFIIGIILLLYVTGWHTQVIGTMQKAVLATGLIKPSVPSLTDDFPPASMDFFFADDSGKVQSLAEYSGDVIFMNIWATWCPPCIAEMPSIHSLYKAMESEKNITFLLVSVDEDFDKAKSFMQARDFDMPIYHFRSRAAEYYDLRSIPTTYVISRDGKMMMEKRGLAKYDTPDFIQFLKELTAL